MLYMLATKVSRIPGGRTDALAGRVFLMVASTVLCKRKCQPGQKALGSMFGRSPRSIQRSLKALIECGVVVKIRRGRKLTNLYRLAEWIWRRITGADRWLRQPKRGLQPADNSLANILAKAREAWQRAQARGAPLPA
jgi:DNA-binding transcriptional ArsR family regulator